MPDHQPTPSPKEVERPRGESSPIDHRHIVCKFKDSFKLPDKYQDHLEQSTELIKSTEWRAGWDQIVKLAPEATFLRIYRILRQEEIEKLSARAKDKDYTPPKFLWNYRLDLPPSAPIARVLEILRGWSIVERSYRAPQPVDPQAVDPSDDPRATFQWYLNPAPIGINARYAWQHHEDANTQQIIDIEQGWKLDHVDLLDSSGNPRAKLLAGDLVAASSSHGTAVLGVICATDNKQFYVGVAPHTSSIQVISHGGYYFNVPEAIKIAATKLKPGSVILLEVTAAVREGMPDLPAEVDPLVFAEIQLASKLGLLVIEAAGNGGRSLDTYQDFFRNPPGGQVLNRTSPQFLDSGALMVGSGTRTDELAGAATPWAPRADSNNGSRIDCFAWGDSVETLSANSLGYATNFSGTSAASAIIAGAALTLQSMAMKKNGNRLSRADVINFLKDDTINTPTIPPKVVGVMPDLAMIGQKHLGLPAPAGPPPGPIV